jgi:hypothetical protein
VALKSKSKSRGGQRRGWLGSASRIILTGCSGPKAQSRSVARRSFAERVKCVLGTWCGDGLGLVVGCWVVLGLGSLRVGCG